MDAFNVDAIVLWGTQGKAEGEMVPASGVHVCTSTDTKWLVRPICFPLSWGAGEELQLHWGQRQRGSKNSDVARTGALRGPGRGAWVGECGCGDPRGMVWSPDFSLSWVEKEFPSHGLAKNVDVTGKGNRV